MRFFQRLGIVCASVRAEKTINIGSLHLSAPPSLHWEGHADKLVFSLWQHPSLQTQKDADISDGEKTIKP